MPLKLYSIHRDYLGTIEVPAKWAETLGNGGAVEFGYVQPTAFSYSGERALTVMSPGKSVTAALIPLRDGQLKGVVLKGITEFEFETMPECSFAPSAAYIHSKTRS